MLKSGPKFITGCVVSMLVMNAVGLGATLARQGLTGASFGAVASFLFENGVFACGLLARPADRTLRPTTGGRWGRLAWPPF